jgi:hypothetical protein
MKNIASVLLLSLSATAFAADGVTKDTNINYNEIGLGYFSIRVSDTYDFNGYAVKGSALITENIYIDAAYASGSYTTSTMTLTEANLGYRFPIAASTDGVASVGYTGITFTDDDSSNGYNIKLGVVSKLTDDFKIGGSFKYTNVTNNDPYNTGTLDAQYNFTKSIYTNISYNSMSGGSTAKYYMVGVGYNF